jgi:EAL domain-containing protein (putative c-di-GMP-specific phosphodiesterase class I)/ActR/RegA family two-component response regulator
MTGKRLLVLDDDEAVAKTVAFVAEASGFEVRTAESARDFFDFIRTWSPTHIVVDLVMPTMDGVEIMRSLATAGCTARIIVTSGVGAKILESAGRAAVERGLRIGGTLPKPFKPVQLRALLMDADEAVAGVERPSRPQAIKEPALTGRDLDEALATWQIVVHYQPKIRLATRQAAGFEALVRWQHPRLGLLLPDRFIPLAESSGRMDRMTRRIVDISLRWFADTCGEPALSLAINISARNLSDVDFADILHAQCAQNRVDPERIILELTESSATHDAAVALDILTRLRIKGFQLSIDDFGTGYSSMTQLAKLPVSELKIDRSFVASMTASAESRKIVESTINLAKALGLSTVAEGVEDAATADMLETLGCDLAQGFHFARAMSGPMVERWLADMPAAAAGTQTRS